jgi:hypothetical protein
MSKYFSLAVLAVFLSGCFGMGYTKQSHSSKSQNYIVSGITTTDAISKSKRILNDLSYTLAPAQSEDFIFGRRGMQITDNNFAMLYVSIFANNDGTNQITVKSEMGKNNQQIIDEFISELKKVATVTFQKDNN